MSGTTDVDWIVVGSGFGGSVAALRLAQKGYSVRVLESGSRFRDEDFAGSTWDARRYFFAPRLGLRGIMRMTLFPDVLIVSGAGVGGGSLGYANTLYRARDAFFEDPRWRDLADWKADLAAHYDTAERMLGVTDVTFDSDGDILLRELAAGLGVEETYGHTRVGVYFGEPDVEHPDPYFDGEGPARTGCIRCGECMVGCRHGAKNTLVKNYLWFAERLGVRIDAERTVTDVRPLGAADGSEGYAVTHVRSGALWRGRGETSTARGVVLAAGALGTNRLLASCRHRGSLPRVSGRLGYLVRTNSESIVAVTAPDDARDFTASVAISSSIYPDPDTHIELVTYGRGGGAMKTMFTALVGDGAAVNRPLRWLAAIARHPDALRTPCDAQLVAAHADRARDADGRQRAAVQAPATALRWRRADHDRAGRRESQPHVHSRRKPRGPVAVRAHRRHPAERNHRGAFQRPVDRAHPRRSGHSRRPLPGGRRRPRPGIRLREPADHRRLRAARQPRRQPEPDDHRAGRTHDRPSADRPRRRERRPSRPGARLEAYFVLDLSVAKLSTSAGLIPDCGRPGSRTPGV